MNNFMKNLQSNSEDTCTTENDTKSEKIKSAYLNMNQTNTPIPR